MEGKIQAGSVGGARGKWNRTVFSFKNRFEMLPKNLLNDWIWINSCLQVTFVEIWWNHDIFGCFILYFCGLETPIRSKFGQLKVFSKFPYHVQAPESSNYEWKSFRNVVISSKTKVNGAHEKDWELHFVIWQEK